MASAIIKPSRFYTIFILVLAKSRRGKFNKLPELSIRSLMWCLPTFMPIGHGGNILHPKLVYQRSRYWRLIWNIRTFSLAWAQNIYVYTILTNKTGNIFTGWASTYPLSLKPQLLSVKSEDLVWLQFILINNNAPSFFPEKQKSHCPFFIFFF